MISIKKKAREKGFRINPGITYFSALVVKIFKVEIGETVAQNFEKGHVGHHKGRERLWIDFFHPKFPSLQAVCSATLFEFYLVIYCYMNVHNTPMGVLCRYYWEYRRIFVMFLSIFCVTTKKFFFPETLYRKWRNIHWTNILFTVSQVLKRIVRFTNKTKPRPVSVKRMQE